jgi:hypothetical protein
VTRRRELEAGAAAPPESEPPSPTQPASTLSPAAQSWWRERSRSTS